MTVIAGRPNGGLHKRRDNWTKAKRVAFIAAMEASCNVRLACEAAGVSHNSAYRLRRGDPVFAAAWSAALEQGCENLRGLMLSRALGTADPELIAANPGPDDLPAPEFAPMSDEMRLKVLQICRATTEGRQGPGGWRKGRVPVRTSADAFASLAAKLDRVERKLKRDAKA
jgi:hypothetical protein